MAGISGSSTPVRFRRHAGRIAPGLDVRGDGAYVIAPPSVHPSGASTRGWSRRMASRRNRAGVARHPCTQAAGTVDLGAGDREHPPPNGGPDSYGAAALDREITALAAHGPGGRNHALNRAASASTNSLPAASSIIATWSSGSSRRAIQRPGRRRRAAPVLATMRSGAWAGMRHPRSRGAA